MSDISVTIALLRAREAMMQHFRPFLQKLDLSETQWRTLRSLYPDHLLDAAELARQAAVLPPSLSRIIKSLDARGLTHSFNHPNDGRRLQIELTEAGRHLMAAHLPESQAIYRKLYGAIGEAQMQAILPMLTNITQACESLAAHKANS